MDATDTATAMSSLTCPSRLLGRSVLQHRTTACCSFRAPTIYVRHKYTLTSLTSNLRTKWALRNPPSLNPSIVRQFTYSAPWNATHLDRQIPRGRPKPSSRSWIDNLPPSVVFWSIFAVNAGVFIAWYYAENNYVSDYRLWGSFFILIVMHKDDVSRQSSL